MFRPLRRRGVFIPFRPRDEPALPPPPERKPPPILLVYRASARQGVKRLRRDYVWMGAIPKEVISLPSVPRPPARIVRAVQSRTTAQHLIKVGRR